MKEIDDEEAWWEEPEDKKNSWDVDVRYYQYLTLDDLKCGIYIDGNMSTRFGGEKLITFESSKDKLIFLKRFDLMQPSQSQKIKSMKIETFDKKGILYRIINLCGVIPVSYEIENNEILISYEYWNINYV